jgi:hypothetical protein
MAIACGSSGEDSGSPEASGDERTTDRPDDLSGPQIHLIYAVPSDAEDRGLDLDGAIATSFAAAQRWLAGETGGRELRLDTSQGEPDVSFIRLEQTDAEVQQEEAFARELVEAELRAAGFNDPEKLYLVYYDGGSTYACGSGAWPPAIEGNVSVLFLHGLPLDGAIRCGDNDFSENAAKPGFWEFVAVHEILHTLGFVPECAPNETLQGHITGPANDVMYDGEEETDQPRALDPGHDDYFETDLPGCPDFADSSFLTP